MGKSRRNHPKKHPHNLNRNHQLDYLQRHTASLPLSSEPSETQSKDERSDESRDGRDHEKDEDDTSNSPQKNQSCQPACVRYQLDDDEYSQHDHFFKRNRCQKPEFPPGEDNEEHSALYPGQFENDAFGPVATTTNDMGEKLKGFFEDMEPSRQSACVGYQLDGDEYLQEDSFFKRNRCQKSEFPPENGNENPKFCPGQFENYSFEPATVNEDREDGRKQEPFDDIEAVASDNKEGLRKTPRKSDERNTNAYNKDIVDELEVTPASDDVHGPAETYQQNMPRNEPVHKATGSTEKSQSKESQELPLLEREPESGNQWLSNSSDGDLRNRKTSDLGGIRPIDFAKDANSEREPSPPTSFPGQIGYNLDSNQNITPPKSSTAKKHVRRRSKRVSFSDDTLDIGPKGETPEETRPESPELSSPMLPKSLASSRAKPDSSKKEMSTDGITTAELKEETTIKGKHSREAVVESPESSSHRLPKSHLSSRAKPASSKKETPVHDVSTSKPKKKSPENFSSESFSPTVPRTVRDSGPAEEDKELAGATPRSHGEPSKNPSGLPSPPATPKSATMPKQGHYEEKKLTTNETIPGTTKEFFDEVFKAPNFQHSDPTLDPISAMPVQNTAPLDTVIETNNTLQGYLESFLGARSLPQEPSSPQLTQQSEGGMAVREPIMNDSHANFLPPSQYSAEPTQLIERTSQACIPVAHQYSNHYSFDGQELESNIQRLKEEIIELLNDKDQLMDQIRVSISQIAPRLMQIEERLTQISQKLPDNIVSSTRPERKNEETLNARVNVERVEVQEIHTPDPLFPFHSGLAKWTLYGLAGLTFAVAGGCIGTIMTRGDVGYGDKVAEWLFHQGRHAYAAS